MRQDIFLSSSEEAFAATCGQARHEVCTRRRKVELMVDGETHDDGEELHVHGATGEVAFSCLLERPLRFGDFVGLDTDLGWDLRLDSGHAIEVKTLRFREHRLLLLGQVRFGMPALTFDAAVLMVNGNSLRPEHFEAIGMISRRAVIDRIEQFTNLPMPAWGVHRRWLTTDIGRFMSAMKRRTIPR